MALNPLIFNTSLPLNSHPSSPYLTNQINEGLSQESINEEIEEVIPLNRLAAELSDPFNDLLKQSCEKALAHYLETLNENNSFSLEEIQLAQRQLQTKLKEVVEYHGHKVQIIDPYCCSISNTSLSPTTHSPSIKIYNANHTRIIPSEPIATNNSKQIDSHSVKKALGIAQQVHEFWTKNFGLNSFDGKGSDLKIILHYDKNFPNAGWNGKQVVVGDGTSIFKNFLNLSLIGHEFGHALTDFKLNYIGEAGSINEHLSDVWGALMTQYQNYQKPHEASWLIGEDVVHIYGKKYPFRSMAAPGTAYNTDIIKDLQSAHYSQRYQGLEDKGGVHLNSGILNHAFYHFAMAEGEYAWLKPGQVWYRTLQERNLKFDCSMAEFAYATLDTALIHFPTDYQMHKNLTAAWQMVGII
jgi:Zn-dependent metalloprotease